MARHHNRNRIRGASSRYGAHRFRGPQRPRHLRISARAAPRDSLQFLPNAQLKCRRLQIERQLHPGRISLHPLHNLFHPSFEGIAGSGNLRLWILIAHLFHQLRVRVSQLNRRTPSLPPPTHPPPPPSFPPPSSPLPSPPS